MAKETSVVEKAELLCNSMKFEPAKYFTVAKEVGFGINGTVTLYVLLF